MIPTAREVILELLDDLMDHEVGDVLEAVMKPSEVESYSDQEWLELTESVADDVRFEVRQLAQEWAR